VNAVSSQCGQFRALNRVEREQDFIFLLLMSSILSNCCCCVKILCEGEYKNVRDCGIYSIYCIVYIYGIEKSQMNQKIGKVATVNPRIHWLESERERSQIDCIIFLHFPVTSVYSRRR
jgi:hypothetical protein